VVVWETVMLSSDIPLSPLRSVTLRRKNNQLGSCPTLEVAAEANDEHMRRLHGLLGLLQEAVIFPRTRQQFKRQSLDC
jgi:hypothetical protein